MVSFLRINLGLTGHSGRKRAREEANSEKQKLERKKQQDIEEAEQLKKKNTDELNQEIALKKQYIEDNYQNALANAENMHLQNLADCEIDKELIRQETANQKQDLEDKHNKILQQNKHELHQTIHDLQESLSEIKSRNQNSVNQLSQRIEDILLYKQCCSAFAILKTPKTARLPKPRALTLLISCLQTWETKHPKISDVEKFEIASYRKYFEDLVRVDYLPVSAQSEKIDASIYQWLNNLQQEELNPINKAKQDDSQRLKQDHASLDADLASILQQLESEYQINLKNQQNKHIANMLSIDDELDRQLTEIDEIEQQSYSKSLQKCSDSRDIDLQTILKYEASSRKNIELDRSQELLRIDEEFKQNNTKINEWLNQQLNANKGVIGNAIVAITNAIAAVVAYESGHPNVSASCATTSIAAAKQVIKGNHDITISIQTQLSFGTPINNYPSTKDNLPPQATKLNFHKRKFDLKPIFTDMDKTFAAVRYAQYQAEQDMFYSMPGVMRDYHSNLNMQPKLYLDNIMQRSHLAFDAPISGLSPHFWLQYEPSQNGFRTFSLGLVNEKNTSHTLCMPESLFQQAVGNFGATSGSIHNNNTVQTAYWTLGSEFTKQNQDKYFKAITDGLKEQQKHTVQVPTTQATSVTSKHSQNLQRAHLQSTNRLFSSNASSSTSRQIYVNSITHANHSDSLSIPQKSALFAKGAAEAALIGDMLSSASKLKYVGNIIKGASATAVAALAYEASKLAKNFNDEFFIYTNDYDKLMQNPQISQLKKNQITQQAQIRLENARAEAAQMKSVSQTISENPQAAGLLVGRFFTFRGMGQLHQNTLNSIIAPVNFRFAKTSGRSINVKIQEFIRKYWSKSVDFRELKVYKRNDIFDPNLVSTWTVKGKKITGTNIERMAAGRAPIGIDGKSVELHHLSELLGPKGPSFQLSSNHFWH